METLGHRIPVSKNTGFSLQSKKPIGQLVWNGRFLFPLCFLSYFALTVLSFRCTYHSVLSGIFSYLNAVRPHVPIQWNFKTLSTRGNLKAFLLVPPVFLYILYKNAPWKAWGLKPWNFEDVCQSLDAYFFFVPIENLEGTRTDKIFAPLQGCVTGMFHMLWQIIFTCYLCCDRLLFTCYFSITRSFVVLLIWLKNCLWWRPLGGQQRSDIINYVN